MRYLLAFVALSILAGCTGSTAVSRQPSEDEIKAGIQRRLDAIDKDPNLTPQAKQIMKSHIQGSGAAQDTSQTRAKETTK